MSFDQFCAQWQWRVRPEMLDKVQRFVFSNLATIVACTGHYRQGTVLTYWQEYAADSSLGMYDLGAWGFRSGPDDCEPGELIAAVCIG